MSEVKHTGEDIWVKIDSDIATVGLEKGKASGLESISFIELPDVGKKINKGEEVVSIETAKSVEKIKSPISGGIVNVNTALKENSNLLVEDPTDKGYLFQIKIEKDNELKEL